MGGTCWHVDGVCGDVVECVVVSVCVAEQAVAGDGGSHVDCCFYFGGGGAAVLDEDGGDFVFWAPWALNEFHAYLEVSDWEVGGVVVGEVVDDFIDADGVGIEGGGWG